jgi:hypothetical protein
MKHKVLKGSGWALITEDLADDGWHTCTRCHRRTRIWGPPDGCQSKEPVRSNTWCGHCGFSKARADDAAYLQRQAEKDQRRHIAGTHTLESATSWRPLRTSWGFQ